MLHRALLGSIERFIGSLIEHFAGRFPLWINPKQIEIIPVADRFADKAYEIAKEIEKAGFRVEVDERSEGVGYKIRSAQMMRTNYMLVVGDKEIESGLLTIRKRDGEETKDVSLEDFIAKISEERDSKSRESVY